MSRPAHLTSLAWRQAKATVLVALLMGIMISLGIILWDFSRTRATIDSMAAQLLRTASNAATQASYSLDAPLAADILDGLLEFESISMAEIITEKDRVLARRDRRANLPAHLLDPIIGAEIRYTRNLTHNETFQKRAIPVGRLIISINGGIAAADFLTRAISEATLGLVRNFLMVVITLMIARRLVTSPLTRLAKDIRAAELKEREVVVTPESHEHDEIGELVASFNHLLSSLSASEIRFRAAFEQSFALCGILDSEGRVILANGVALSLINARLEEVAGKPFWDTPWWRKEEDSAWLSEAIATTANGQSVRREAFHIGVDGRRLDIDFVLSPVHIGDEVQVMAMGLDISERKAAEAERERLMIGLSRSNAELSRFAEVSAHHLQEPARRLAIFAQRLKRSDETRMGPDGVSSLGIIEADAMLLIDLLRDIQLFLVADQPRGDIHASCASDALKAAIARIPEGGSDKQTNFKHSELPEALIDQARLTDVFSAIIDNAVKFRSPERPCIIDVKGAIHNGRAIYRIADNGIGIAEEYQEQVFGIFQRLHPVSHCYAGTGIGLALVRKIVNSCGGAVRIAPSTQGTVVDVSLPLRNDIFS